MATAFDTDNKEFERKSKLKGIVVSIAIHVVVLFITIPILGLKAPNPPIGGGGVEVNFGTSDVGSGDVQPMNNDGQKAVTNPPPSASVSQPTPDKDQKIVTQDVEDAPAINQSKNTKTIVKKHTKTVKKVNTTSVAENPALVTTTKVTKTPPTPPAPTVDQRAMYKGAKGTYE